MAAHLSLDPEVHLPKLEAGMANNGDFDLPRAFRDQARVWSQSEFTEYINKITQGVTIHT
ncbi:hypothetical protein KMP13_05730 [Epibacterium ulvae]|uniref:hypothetical protein n=1 Tax=Epibacterium ulvae TaxID=1156985 RepID=UPI001BFC4F44|nr:hypothetical protein [Epibacterium ulvae]MBT8153400.1 hypothetical protein [Epibacterium ulvae]